MSKILSVRLVGSCTAAVAFAALALTGACGSSSDNARNPGSAGSGASTAGASGSNNTAGASGTGPSTAGASGTQGTAGASGSGTAGASSCTETNTTDVCDTSGKAPNLYNAPSSAPTCGSTILKLPNAASPNTYWFSYGDATMGAMKTAQGEKCGCGGPSDCAFHTFGMGFSDYGAGIGFDLNEDTTMNNAAIPYDASMYSGVKLWAKGTTTGTRGKNYAMSDNTIHVKLVTNTDRHGDDFGMYFPIGTDWTAVDVPFNMAYRDGFCTPTSASPCADPTTDTIDVNQMLKIQIEFSEHSATDADGGTVHDTVNFDVWVDDISIY